MSDNSLQGFASIADFTTVFKHVVAAAAPLIPHDGAVMALFSPDGQQVVHVARTTKDIEFEDSWLLADPAATVTGLLPPGETGFRNWLKTPVTIENVLAGVLVFVGPGPTHYGTRDILHAQRVAATLSVFAGDGHVFDPKTDPSEEVLEEIAHVLNVREVFPRISAIVNRLLPHDLLTMTFHDPDGRIGLEAESYRDSPTFRSVHVDPDILARPYLLLPEVTAEALADYQPVEARETLLRSGFLSFLAVNVAAGDQRMGVEFWSKHLHGFSAADVPVARRIANYVAVAVSHEQLAEAEQQMVAARTRAQRVEERLKTLSAPSLQTKARPIVSESAAWKPILRSATRVADSDATVLLTGESGTGKEVIARFIHAASPRSRGPFVAVNCATLPDQLLESEIFGHERGAFTGASQFKPGQIEVAAGGVLFLDEVSEMSLSAQAKFLRLLQEREFRRLGGTRTVKADVRVIAATNVNLQHAIERGVFRRDLYYRLRVVDLELPALRERQEDILPLADALLAEINETLRRPALTLSPPARKALHAYRWPGNVRELRNVLERAAILCDGGAIELRDLSFDPPSSVSTTTNVVDLEREMIERVLRECRGNKSRAARKLGLTRMQLYGRLRRYGYEDVVLQ